MGPRVEQAAVNTPFLTKERGIKAVKTTLVVAIALVAIASIASGVGVGLGIAFLSAKILSVIALSTSFAPLAAVAICYQRCMGRSSSKNTSSSPVADTAVAGTAVADTRKLIGELSSGGISLGHPQFKPALHAFLSSLESSTTHSFKDGTTIYDVKVEGKSCKFCDGMLRNPNLPNEICYQGNQIREKDYQLTKSGKESVFERSKEEWGKLIVDLHGKATLPFEGVNADMKNPIDVLLYYLNGNASSVNIDGYEESAGDYSLTPPSAKDHSKIDIQSMSKEQVVFEAELVGSITSMSPKDLDKTGLRGGGIPPVAQVGVSMRYTITKQDKGDCHIAVERTINLPSLSVVEVS